jgi:hypothetical protein
MGKRGQITIFIIIAITIISISFLVYFVYPKINATFLTSDPVYIYLEGCIEDAILSSAQIFGYQQGYHTPPARTLRTNSSNIAYYYFEGEVHIPGNNFFENELAKIINERIVEECTNFLFFEEDGYLIEFENPSTRIEISEETFNARVNFPVTAIYGNDASRFSDFIYNPQIRISYVIETSRKLVEKIRDDPSAIDLTFFLDQDVDISISEYDKCNQVYIITDPKSRSWLQGEEYAFAFAVKLEDRYCEI